MPHQPICLWPAAPAGDPRQDATLTFYPCPDPAAKAAVMVCPGGAYSHLANHEGPTIAQWFNASGFHAAVLRYRVAPNRHPAMIHDAQRGLRLMRASAAQWGFAADGIAVMGFSAGGHLASSLAVHFDRFPCPEDDLAGKVSARPDAAILCYAVIDMIGVSAHSGSRKNLLGDQADQALCELMSSQLQVTAHTPPTFLWHTADDSSVPLDNCLLFASALRRHQVPLELHVYESGRHGLGLAGDFPDVRPWTDACLRFLRRRLMKQP